MTTKLTTKNPCTICGKPGLTGLKRGQGKCQYHWNAGVWGKDWADKVAQNATDKR